MGKVLIITCIVYLLYYAGNVAYDLFIKKPPVVRNENDGEIISLGEIIEDEITNVQSIKEEDVENLNTPSSYIIEDEEALFSDEENSNTQKERYDEEREIDNYIDETPELAAEEKQNQSSFLSKLTSAIKVREKEIISKETDFIPNVISDDMFRNFFEKASSHIVVGNDNGRNFYKSSLIF